MSLPIARQRALAFNQPLSLDTSSVTVMNAMFFVRFRAYLWPCTHDTLHTSLPVTRQYTLAFNQPLRLNTSSVTDMNGMFTVRFRAYPLPNLHAGPPCTRC